MTVVNGGELVLDIGIKWGRVLNVGVKLGDLVLTALKFGVDAQWTWEWGCACVYNIYCVWNRVHWMI